VSLFLNAFEPTSFYGLAVYIKDELLDKAPQELREAASRTCVSRAYYAAFLLLRDAILMLPIRDAELRRRIERTNVAHAIVAEVVRAVDANVGDYFVNLRRLRNRADYETRTSFSPADVVYALKIAGEIINNSMTIASKVQEPVILSAWGMVQERRKRMRRRRR
jgi:uncharacterized protein (UPF0332 family)